MDDAKGINEGEQMQKLDRNLIWKLIRRLSFASEIAIEILTVS